MSLALNCRIEIDGKYVLKFANKVRIESTWKNLGDKCDITFPLKGVLKKTDTQKEQFSFEDNFKTGMSVKVELKYEGKSSTEFEGYIAKIRPSKVFEILCEDELYVYKRMSAVSSVYTGTLRGLIGQYFSGAEISDSIPDMKLVNFQLKRVTPAEILQKLKQEYLLAAYFRNKVLYVGLPYTDFGLGRNVKLDFQKNIISDSSLEYKTSEDVKIKIRAVSFLANNTKIEVEAGDSEGEERTVFFYGETDKSKIQDLANSKLAGLKQDGYSGSLDLFGIPVMQHSDTVSPYDIRYRNRDGQKYFVDGVVKEFQPTIYRQKINLGIKVS